MNAEDFTKDNTRRVSSYSRTKVFLVPKLTTIPSIKITLALQFMNTFSSITHAISVVCEIAGKTHLSTICMRKLRLREVLLLVQDHVPSKSRSQCSNPSLMKDRA